MNGKRITILVVCFLITLSVSGYAALPSTPDQTLLSTAVGTVTIVDSFLVSASPGGISVYKYQDDPGQFDFVNRIYFDMDTVDAKRFDTLLVLHGGDGQLHFFSIADLPDVRYLQSIHFDLPFDDFTINNNSLYVTAYFDGVLRFDITDLNQPQFADSSMKGILVTQIENDGNYLYVLDEYNGLLRYQFTGSGFGQFVDYLYVPLRAFAFTEIDSLFYLHTNDGKLLIGDFEQPHNMQIIDTISDVSQVVSLYATDSLLLVCNQRILTAIDRNDFTNRTEYDISINNPIGTLYTTGVDEYLVLPNLEGGMTIYDPRFDMASFNGLTNMGMINDMYIYNNRLFVSNTEEPIHTYTVETSGFTSYDFTIYEDLINTGNMQHNGDSLFSIYPEYDRLALFVNSYSSDSVFLENSISIAPAAVRGLYYNEEQIYDFTMLIVQHPFYLDIYTVSDSGYVLLANRWNFVADITSLAVKGTTAFITDTKNECSIYHIDSFFNRQLIKSISLADRIEKSVIYGDTLYLIDPDEFIILDISNPDSTDIDTTIATDRTIVDASLYKDYLYGVGYDGISVYGLSNGKLPELLTSGGLRGTTIAADSNVIAVSDETNLMLYYYHPPVFSNPGEIIVDDGIGTDILSQNYPNPFNLETSISYNLPKRSMVELSVFNILGQEVRTLLHEPQDAGEHTVSWDGKNNGGETVTSGIYLYRIKTVDGIESKKMILMK